MARSDRQQKAMALAKARKAMDASNRAITAVAKVETGGEKDPFIRTRFIPKGGSTAYGPLQITVSLAKGFNKNKAKTKNFTPEEKDYLQRFIQQGAQFNKFGNEPDKEGFDPKYDYGGGGDLTSDEDKKLYWSVARKMFNEELKGSTDPDDIAKIWHGGKDEKKISDYAAKLRAAGL